jgi:hypothetical protein
MFRAFRHFPSQTRPAPGRTSLRFLLALFYLTLGVSAAWHAPHFSRAETAVDTDRHEEHEAVNGEACALCTVKNAPHQSHASVVPFVGSAAAAFSRVFRADGTPARFQAFLARGPPALLS